MSKDSKPAEDFSLHRRGVLRMGMLGAACLALPSSACADGGTDPQRLWPLSGALNTRDLGGYAAADRRRVLPGRIIRSCELSYLSDEDVRFVEARKVSVVIDLRGQREAQAAPDRLPASSRRVSSPIIGDELDQTEINRFLAKAGLPDSMQDAERVWRLGPFYRMLKLVNSYGDDSFLERLGAGNRPIFEHLLSLPDGEALLFHDTGGRDRVGIAAALILHALGVSQEDIIRNYLESNVNLQPDRTNPDSVAFERFRYTPVYIQPPENRRFQAVAKEFGTLPATIFEAVKLRPDLLETMFTALPKRYGSMEAFQSSQLGLGPSELKELRRKFLQ